MLLNILCFAFVSAFIALVVFGHVLLAAAIWPNFFASIRTKLLRKRIPAPNATPDGVASVAAPSQAGVMSSNEVTA